MTRIKYKEALGLEIKRGKPSLGKKPAKKELQRLYIKESRSIRDIADLLGCTKDMVYRALKEYVIGLRSGVCRSKLRKHKLSTLEKGIREKGVKGYAEELGVHENTLRYYLKGVKKDK